MSRVLLNSLSGAVRLVAFALTAFFLTPVVVRALGNDAYGAWEILLSIQAYLVLLDLGVNPAVIRFVARSKAQGAHDMLQAVFGTALFTAVIGGVIGLGLIWWLAMSQERFLDLEVAAVPGLRIAFLVVGVQVLVNFAGAVFVATLMGLQRHYLVNAVKIVAVIVQTVVVYLGLTRASGPGLAWLAVTYSASAVVQNLVLAGALIWGGGEPRVVVRPRVSWSVMKELYAFGFKSVTLMAAQRLQKQLMPILIGWVLSVGQVVYFTLPSRLIDYAHDLAMSLGFPLTARFSELDGKGDITATRDAWIKYTKFLQLVVIPLGVGILIFGESFLNIWIGSEYGAAGRWVVRILAVAFLVEGLAPNAGRLLVALGMHGRAAAWSLVIALASVPVAVLMARAYGVSGIAGALLLARTVRAGVTWYLAAGAIGISMARHLRQTALRFVIGALLQALALMLLLARWNPTTYGSLLSAAALSLVPFLLVSWFVALTGEERAMVTGWLPRRGRAV